MAKDNTQLFREVAGAAHAVAVQRRRLDFTPPVDDDFPQVKHEFDSAVKDLVRAASAYYHPSSLGLPTSAPLTTGLNALAAQIHKLNRQWWHDIDTDARLDRNKGEMLMLIVSEVAEALEGERKNIPDTHLPHRRMAEVELADVLIRVLDYCAGHGYDVEGALNEKCEYNKNRADHKAENRRKADGKKF